MKALFLALSVFLAPLVLAQAPTPAPSPLVTAVPGTTTVTMPEALAPPEWATDVLNVVNKLPVVGPIVEKVVMYVGILGSLMTALVAFLLAVSEAIQQVTHSSGLVELAAKIQAFQDGKIMYYLKMLSLFNAKAPPVPTTQLAEAVADKTDKIA